MFVLLIKISYVLSSTVSRTFKCTVSHFQLYSLNLFSFHRPLQNWNAGMLAGVCTTVIMAPGERIKCLLQVRLRITVLTQ